MSGKFTHIVLRHTSYVKNIQIIRDEVVRVFEGAVIDLAFAVRNDQLWVDDQDSKGEQNDDSDEIESFPREVAPATVLKKRNRLDFDEEHAKPLEIDLTNDKEELNMALFDTMDEPEAPKPTKPRKTGGKGAGPWRMHENPCKIHESDEEIEFQGLQSAPSPKKQCYRQWDAVNGWRQVKDRTKK